MHLRRCTGTARLRSTTPGNWRSHPQTIDFNVSDHNSIEFNVITDKIIIEPQWIWSQANWDLFSSEIENNLITQAKYVITQRECDNMVNTLYNSTISKALETAVPKSKKRTVDRNNPWWEPIFS